MNEAPTSRRFGVVTAALIGILLLALFYPTIRWLVSEWLGNDYYSHGFIVPVISAVLAWRLWVKWPPEQRRIKGLSWRSRFRHYTNLRRTESRFVKLLSEFSFNRMDSILAVER